MSYLLDNQHTLANERFACLEELYDNRSFDLIDRHISHLDTVWLPGAGSGSLARPLSYVAKKVIVTDMNTTWFPQFSRESIEAYEQNLDTDPYPECTVIHARLVLQHIPGWKRLLAKFWDHLPEGGLLIVEELDPVIPYRPEPKTEEDRLQNWVGNGFTTLLGLHGADYASGRELVGTLGDAGFGIVHAEGYQATGFGNNAATKLMKVNAQQTRKELVDRAGVSNADVDKYIELLDKPGTWFHMPVMYSVVAVKKESK